MAEVTARISRKEGDENDSDRGQQLINGKEEAGEAPVKDKCRKKYAKNNRIMYPNDEADSRCVKSCYAGLSSVT